MIGPIESQHWANSWFEPCRWSPDWGADNESERLLAMPECEVRRDEVVAEEGNVKLFIGVLDPKGERRGPVLSWSFLKN